MDKLTLILTVPQVRALVFAACRGAEFLRSRSNTLGIRQDQRAHLNCMADALDLAGHEMSEELNGYDAQDCL